MSSFTTPLRVEYIDGFNWRILEPFDYYRNDDPSSLIRIPADFITDFASVPKFFWQILPPLGTYGKAAVVHDWLYSTELYRRKDCDLVFYEASGVLAVPLWKRWVMYRAVRNFGAGTWVRGHTLESVNGNRDLAGDCRLEELDHSWDYCFA